MLKHFSQVVSMLDHAICNNDFQNLARQLKQSFDWNELIEEGQQERELIWV